MQLGHLEETSNASEKEKLPDEDDVDKDEDDVAEPERNETHNADDDTDITTTNENPLLSTIPRSTAPLPPSSCFSDTSGKNGEANPDNEVVHVEEPWEPPDKLPLPIQLHGDRYLLIHEVQDVQAFAKIMKEFLESIIFRRALFHPEYGEDEIHHKSITYVPPS